MFYHRRPICFTGCFTDYFGYFFSFLSFRTLRNGKMGFLRSYNAKHYIVHFRTFVGFTRVVGERF